MSHWRKKLGRKRKAEAEPSARRSAVLRLMAKSMMLDLTHVDFSDIDGLDSEDLQLSPDEMAWIINTRLALLNKLGDKDLMTAALIDLNPDLFFLA